MSDPDDWYGFHLDHYIKPPDYGYQTKNGSFYFILRRGNSEDWDRLVMELGMEEALADPRFADYGRAATSIGRYATEVKPIWEKAFANRTREELIDLVKSIGGDAVPIMDYPIPATILRSRRWKRRGNRSSDGGRFKTVRPVARFSDTQFYSTAAAGAWATYRRGPASGGPDARRLTSSSGDELTRQASWRDEQLLRERPAVHRHRQARHVGRALRT